MGIKGEKKKRGWTLGFIFFALQLLPTTYVQCYRGYYRKHELIRWTDSQTVPRTQGGLPVVTGNVQITCRHGQIMHRFLLLIVFLKLWVKQSCWLWNFWSERWDAGMTWFAVAIKREKNMGSVIVLILIQPSTCFTFKNNWCLRFLLEAKFLKED